MPAVAALRPGFLGPGAVILAAASANPDFDIAQLQDNQVVHEDAFSARFDEIRGDALLKKGDKAGALAAYRAALGAKEPGLVDTGLLQLKINDLGVAEAESSVTPPPAEASQ